MNDTFTLQMVNLFRKTGLKRGAVFGGIIILALLAFEAFNFSTTDFSLTDLLGADLAFLGVRWATILSIAFCGIDFAGIARLFTPEEDSPQAQGEVWFLFGAWFLAACMNATLTWWGVSVAIQEHTALGSAIVGRDILTKVIPVFVAILVCLIRLLIIGTFSMAGDRLFSMADSRPANRPSQLRVEPANRQLNQAVNLSPRPFQKPVPQNNLQHPFRPEPTYQPASLTAKSKDDDKGAWR
jgi:hypothetical protein